MDKSLAHHFIFCFQLMNSWIMENSALKGSYQEFKSSKKLYLFQVISNVLEMLFLL